MMPQGKGKSAAVILICFVVQMVDCYRLKKREIGDGQRDASTAEKQSIQEGKIVFGRVFKKGSDLESDVFDRTGRSSSNTSVTEGTAYQADSAGWSKGQTYARKSTQWKRMAPSLQCVGDRMRFKVMGPGASVFALDQGSAPPMPLSQVPSTCGYHVQRNALGLTMLVPYHGCNVVQENGSYVLPMHWQGIPVSLWCPKSTSVPHTASQPQMMPVLPSGETPVGSYPDFPQSYFFSPYLPFPRYRSALPLPTTDSTTTFPQDPFFPSYPFPLPLPGKTGPESNGTTPEKPRRPGFPQDPFLPFYPYFPLPGKPEMPGFPRDPLLPSYHFPLPLPGKTGPESNGITPEKPRRPGFPQDPFLPFYPYFPSPFPDMTGAQSTSTTPDKPLMPGFPHPPLPFYPFTLPFPGKPGFPHPPLPFYPFPLPLPGKTGPESNGTTPEKPRRPGFPQDPFLPFYPYFPSLFPDMIGAQSTSTPGKPEMPGFPQDPSLPLPFYPYFPSPLPGKTDVPTPTSKPKLPWDFHPPFYPPFPWPGQDVPPGFLPSMAQNTATQMTMTPESQLMAQFFLFGSQYPHFDLCDPKWPVLIRKHCSQQKP